MDKEVGTNKKFADELAEATEAFIKEALKIAGRNNVESITAMGCLYRCISVAVAFDVYKKLEEEIEEEEKKCLS